MGNANGNAMVVGRKQKQKFSAALQTDTYQNMIRATLQDVETQKAFNKGILAAVAANPQLQECTNASILAGGLKGASMNLNPNPELGQFYLVPFKNQLKDSAGNKLWVLDENGNKVKDDKGKWIPVTENVAQFVLSYRGFIQCAARSSIYKKIVVTEVKEGELQFYDPFNEEISYVLIKDYNKRKAAPTIGYYAMFEYIKGFQKSIYWSKEEMIDHADQYSSAFSADTYRKYIAGEISEKDMWKCSSFWYKDFDAMARKTMVRQLLGKWGALTTEMQNIILQDGTVSHVEGNEIVTDELTEVSNVVSIAAPEDSRSEYIEAVEQIDLDSLEDL